MRVIGVDFGDRRTGIAVSDPFGWSAQGLEAVSGDMKKAVERIVVLAEEYGAEIIVVGYPLNMNGTAGYRAKKTDDFIEAIDKRLNTGRTNIVRWDERLTSVAASNIMKETGRRPTSRKEREKGGIDVLSAAILLQSYLDSGQGEKTPHV